MTIGLPANPALATFEPAAGLNSSCRLPAFPWHRPVLGPSSCGPFRRILGCFYLRVTNRPAFRCTWVERRVDHARRYSKSTLFSKSRQKTMVCPAPCHPVLSPVRFGRRLGPLTLQANVRRRYKQSLLAHLAASFQSSLLLVQFCRCWCFAPFLDPIKTAP